MAYGINMTCDDCSHKEICNKKETLKFIQKQINENINCTLENCSILNVKDCSWINVDLQCKYWKATGQTFRKSGVYFESEGEENVE